MPGHATADDLIPPMATQTAPLVARSNCSTWPPVFEALISASS